jgi:hypothetical protein
MGTSTSGGGSSNSTKAPKLMCVAELQRELRRHGVNSTGEKALLVRRLEQTLANLRKTGAAAIPQTEPRNVGASKRRMAPIHDEDDSAAWLSTKKEAVVTTVDVRTPKQRRLVVPQAAPSSAPPLGVPQKPKPNSRIAALTDEIGTLLSAAQKTAAHAKHCDSLVTLFERSHRSDFTLAFVTHLNTIVACEELDVKPTARLCEFVASFCNRVSVAGPNGSDVLLSLYMIDLLRRRLDVQEKTVRLRACELLGELLAQLPANVSVPTRTLEELYQSLESRTADRHASVRLAAVRALARLQSSLEPVRATLRQLLGDANTEVRLAAAEVMLLSGDDSVDAMLVRTRDCDERVRRIATESLLTNIELRSLHRPQRALLVANVLDERVVEARDAAMTLLHERWLTAQCDDNVERLLRSLTVSASARHTETGLRLLHELLPLLGKFDPAFDAPDKLTIERALIWRAFSELYGSSDAFALELSRFAELIRVNQSNEFVATQLLCTCRTLDLQDEVGRRALTALLRSMLPDRDVPVGVLPAAMLLLRDISSSVAEFCDFVVEAVAEIREPLDFHDATSPQKKRAPPVMALDNAKSLSQSLPADGWPLLGGNGDDESAALQAESPQMRELTAKLALLVSKKQELVQQERFERAAAIKAKCEEVQRDIDVLRAREAEAVRRERAAEHAERARQLASREARVLMRCLVVIEQMFGITSAAPARVIASVRAGVMESMLTTVIVPALTHRFPAVRAPAVRALGLYCTQTSMDEARPFLPLLLSVMSKDRIAIRCDALRALCDVLCAYKLDALFADDTSVASVNRSRAESPLKRDVPPPTVTRALVIERLLALLDGQSGAALAAVAVEGVCKMLHLGLFALDGQDRGAVDEAFVLLTTLYARWSGARNGTGGEDESDAVVVEADLDTTEDDEFMKMTLAAAPESADEAEGVDPRTRALQVLAVFFAAAERNARLCVIAARTFVEIVRRAFYGARKNLQASATATTAATTALRLVACAPSSARLACTRLLLCEILANVSGPERAHVKFLSLLPPQTGDDALELSRVRTLTEMCKSEISDRALVAYEKALDRAGARALDAAETRKLTELARAHRRELSEWLQH